MGKSRDFVADYQLALKRMAAAESEVRAVTVPIFDAAWKLLKWKRVVVTNISEVFPLTDDETLVIDAEGWPGAGQLAVALAAWHVDHAAAVAAYDAIPAREKRGVARPPA